MNENEGDVPKIVFDPITSQTFSLSTFTENSEIFLIKLCESLLDQRSTRRPLGRKSGMKRLKVELTKDIRSILRFHLALSLDMFT